MSFETRYVHLSGRDVDGALARHYGLASEDGGRYCPRCGFLAHKGANFCPRCSALLSEAEAVRLEERRMLEDQIVEKVVRKLIELAPDILERALLESGAVEELKEITEPHQSGAGGEI